jgi:hypothetical protein
MLSNPQKGNTYGVQTARKDGVDKRQRQAKETRQCEGSIEPSLKQLPEPGPGGVPADKDPGFKKCLRKILGVGKCQGLGDGFQLMDEMNQHLHSRSQVQDAGDLALSLKCSRTRSYCLELFQSALIFQGEACSVIANPHVDYGVVVLLVRRPRNRIEGSDFDFRLPTGKLVLVRQGELNCVQFERMERPGKREEGARYSSARRW